MRKVCIALIIVMVLATSSYAAVMARTSMDLTFSGTTANCCILVKETGSDIDVNLKLYRGATLIKSWNKTGLGRVELDKTWSCTSGLTYTLQADVTINGVPVSVSPVTKNCP